MARVINGMLLDGNSHSGQEILSTVPAGRRAVIVEGGHVKPLSRKTNYNSSEITRKVKIIPDRCKGSFSGTRDERSKRMIREQILDVSKNLFRDKCSIDFDDIGYDWVVFENYRLPGNWGNRVVPMMILFPTEYPILPPIGFYLPNTISSPNGHLFDGAYHGADEVPIQEGWRWYCAYIPQGSWRPAWGRYADDWRKGDNLWDYLTLVGEVLSGGDE